MTIDVVMASGNLGKIRELEVLFAEPRIRLVSMKGLVPPGFDVEETGTTFEENAWLKAMQVCAELGRPALADDSGLEVDALGGRPGVYSARYAGVGATDESNNELLLKELSEVPEASRTARFVCVLALCVPSKEGPVRVASARGVIEGSINHGARGSHGFGYDPLFVARDLGGLTTAEISPEEKNRISHRAKAAKILSESISVWLDGLPAGT